MLVETSTLTAQEILVRRLLVIISFLGSILGLSQYVELLLNDYKRISLWKRFPEADPVIG